MNSLSLATQAKMMGGGATVAQKLKIAESKSRHHAAVKKHNTEMIMLLPVASDGIDSEYSGDLLAVLPMEYECLGNVTYTPKYIIESRTSDDSPLLPVRFPEGCE